ncbi:hypothetical protein [Clostridium saccharoperbutylacetonicum]|uniref:hypothetical protein n=1 Tax=Clostridium saccharoperbutylacetonicum TaxID=36745 RepID=UPI000983C99B|nr:hypothetical protein [Clostridium saccharoperbutylacetonicum]AQR95229.1 hypothetical protein CLSAP_25450 [Clostridium saccharoperbutylacetonicum]NSB31083.1 hypothetical protein [Clostridium saccharoperbutylacetonicum]
MSSATMTISAKKKLENKDHNAIITNSTSETLVVFGPIRETEGGNYENSWYVLHPGKTTPGNWQCDGIYVPKDREFKQMNGQITQGPIAIKYGSLIPVTITQAGKQYSEKDHHNEGIFHSTEINWDIPNFTAEYCQNISMEKYQIP